MAPKLSPSSVSTMAGDETFSNYGSSRPNTPGNQSNMVNGTSQRSAIQISWNKTITSATSVSDITDLMYLYGNQFNAVNIATSLHRLASQFRFDVRRYSEAIRIVLDRARDTNFEGFSPRELANVIWAMAKTEMPCKEDVFNHVSRKAICSFSDVEYTPQAIANLLWGMAKAGYPNEALFDHLSAIAVRTGLRGFNAQNLSNSLWALSTAQLPNSQLFNMIGDFIVAEHNNLKGFSPQNMANAVWAMAKVNMPHIELFELISLKATESKFSGFKPQEIANLVWAMSTCRLTKLDLIIEVCAEIRNLVEWKPQELSNLVWAAGVCKELHSGSAILQAPQYAHLENQFVSLVIEEVERRGGIVTWKPTEVSNLVHGLVTLGSEQKSSAIVSFVTPCIAKIKRENGFIDWKMNELNNFVSGTVTLGLVDAEFLLLIAIKAAELYGQEPFGACAPSADGSSQESGSRKHSLMDDEDEGGILGLLPPVVDFSDFIQ